MTTLSDLIARPKRAVGIGPSIGIETVDPLLSRIRFEGAPAFFFRVFRLMRVLLPGNAIAELKVNEVPRGVKSY